ncbi:helix-turn-helix domain-containing protein [Flavobacterium sp.]|uniref:helix-turn-helix domain-containing protein n=1 Tax=Flavobacterium sp. TaxID=239 RepID=UPI00403465A8
MKIYIKNMVCSRCIMLVKSEMDRLKIGTMSIALGEVETVAGVPEKEMEKLAVALQSLGFELYDDKKTKLVEKIKQQINELLDAREFDHSISISQYLSSTMHQDYSAISSLFSYFEDSTIEQYYISQKIERVKENIVYTDLSLSDIARKLGYSSIAHLSSQFKKVTGLTPSYYKALREDKKQYKA